MGHAVSCGVKGELCTTAKGNLVPAAGSMRFCGPSERPHQWCSSRGASAQGLRWGSHGCRGWLQHSQQGWSFLVSSLALEAAHMKGAGHEICQWEACCRELLLSLSAEQVHESRLRLPLKPRLTWGPQHLRAGLLAPFLKACCSAELAPPGEQMLQGCHRWCCCWSRSPLGCAGPQERGLALQRVAALRWATQRAAVLAQRRRTAWGHPPASAYPQPSVHLCCSVDTLLLEVLSISVCLIPRAIWSVLPQPILWGLTPPCPN